FPHGRQQLHQRLLRAARIAELVQDEQPHARTASARTQKYTGSTRQYVSRSPEAICTTCPDQKQSIQVPKKERRVSGACAARREARRMATFNQIKVARPPMPVSTSRLRYMLSAITGVPR